MARKPGRGTTPPFVQDLLRIVVREKSQNVVAKEIGIGVAAVNRYLKGIGEPTSETYEKLAGYFGISVWHLRGESGGSIWMASDDIIDKILSISVSNFETLTEHDFIYTDDFFYIGVCLSLATLVLEIPAEKNIDSKKEYILMAQEKAKTVIAKYGNYYKSQSQEDNYNDDDSESGTPVITPTTANENHMDNDPTGDRTDHQQLAKESGQDNKRQRKTP